MSTRRTGRPPLTSAEALLAAARAVGFDGLTVGAVTQQVGVKYSTFYRHYPNLAALRDALIDAVLEGEPWPDGTQPWREHLAEMAATLYRIVREHPGFAPALTQVTAPPAQLEQARSLAIDVLGDAGARSADAAVAVLAVIRAVTAHDPARDDPARVDSIPDELTQNGITAAAATVELLLDGVGARLRTRSHTC